MTQLKKQLVLVTLSLFFTSILLGQTKVVAGPPGSGKFGKNVTVLKNGNYVVTDPFYDNGSAIDAGAVYLYNGLTHSLISTIKGTTQNDRIGYNGVLALTNGNFVICSMTWNSPTNVNVGAVTWGSGTTGISGVVSASNSHIGSKDYDQVGNNIKGLTNGNYVVINSYWSPSTSVFSYGAVTWADGTTGISGIVSASNSLICSNINSIGSNVIPLPNGNYLVLSQGWNNGSIQNVGAVTWGSGTSGVKGLLSASNSLIGSTANDEIGKPSYVSILENGNYIVVSPYWDNGSKVDAGAVTWGNSATGVSGVISASNSLVGNTAYDRIGSGGASSLFNGNYVVASPRWDSGSRVDVGAATWINGAIGLTGYINQNNSLIGDIAGCQVATMISSLYNGNYVVSSVQWTDTVSKTKGAVTWGNGATGTFGKVSISNSMIGKTHEDWVGYRILPLLNGNYVIGSPYWDTGSILNVGAATWCSGNGPTSGTVSAANSLIGSTTDDFVSLNMQSLYGGNYLINCTTCDYNALAEVGAVTWANGTTGTIGKIDSNNSIIGTHMGDALGDRGILPLTSGNYVILSNYWDRDSLSNASAATWGNSSNGTHGNVNITNSMVGSNSNPNTSINIWGRVLNTGDYLLGHYSWKKDSMVNVSAVAWQNKMTGGSGVYHSGNSLVGSHANDNLGTKILDIKNGYIVESQYWDNGNLTDAGAISITNDGAPLIGEITDCNSILGNVSNPINKLVYVEDSIYNYIIVGIPEENKIVIRKYKGFNKSSFSKTICSNQSYLWNGIARNTSGNYLDTFITSHGCDSIVTLMLTVYPTKSTSFSQTICSNQIYIWNGIVRDTSGNFLDTFIGYKGCDSVVTLMLTVLPGNSNSSSFSATICANQNYLWNGIVHDSSGSFKDTFPNFQNCDSIVTLNLTVNKIKSSSFNQTICSNQIYIWNGIAHDTSGNFKDTFPSFQNCDSIVTLHLTVNPTKSSSFNQTICSNQTYNWNGIAQSTTGAYKDTFQNFQNCDSVVTLNLTVNPTKSSSFNQAICVNQSYTWNGIAQSTAGSYKDTFPSFQNCDSVVTLNLTVNPTKLSSFNKTICANQTYLWNGIAQNTTGSYKDTFPSFQNCDSVVTLNLTVNPTKSSSFNKTICANQSYTWNGIAQTAAGAYKDTFIDANGCDSIVTLNLVVTPLPSILTTVSGKTITAAQAGATYYWFNCTTNSIITGANGQSYTATSNGSYKLAVILNNCIDTSSCIPISGVALNNIADLNSIIIYPNPSNGSFTISSKNIGNYTLFNEFGQLIQIIEFKQSGNQSQTIENLSNGVYFLVNTEAPSELKQKIVIIK